MSSMALPLVSMQYTEVSIEIICRPILDLFVVRDIEHYAHNTDQSCNYIPYTATCHTDPYYKLYYFLYEPPRNQIGITGTVADDDLYPQKRVDWNADIHLMSRYIFLDNEQVKDFALNKQCYLIKEVHEQRYYNIVAMKEYLQLIQTAGLVVSWMWFFQRSDVNKRNEWSNYSNWDYNYIPYAATSFLDVSTNPTPTPLPYTPPGVPICQPTAQGKLCSLYLSGPLHIENEYNIMTTWGLTLDNLVRETRFGWGVPDYIEKYARTTGNGKKGVYCYNFCISTNPFTEQPSGAINISKFNTIGFQYTTIEPPDASGNIYVSQLCNYVSPPSELPGPQIATNKPYWADYKYSFNLHIMEERYNMLVIESGVANLALSRQ